MKFSNKLTKLINLIKYDVNIGIVHRWKVHLFSILIFVFPCFYLLDMFKLGNSTPTLMDYFIYYFKGMEVYIPSQSDSFMIPVVFLLFNLYLAFIIGGYPLQDLHSNARNILVRARSRWSWWCSKCVWVILNVIIYYCLFYLSCIIFAGATGGLSLKPTTDVLLEFLNIDVVGVSINNLVIAIIITPLVTSISISLFQMTLAFITKPIYSYIVTILIFVISAYFTTPLLIGNYPMLMRNSLLIPNGIDSLQALTVSSIIAIASIVVGYYLFLKIDILDQ